jgi:hypothetical protein
MLLCTSSRHPSRSCLACFVYRPCFSNARRNLPHCPFDGHPPEIGLMRGVTLDARGAILNLFQRGRSCLD